MITVQILELGSVPEEKLAYAVVAARYKDHWVWVRHRDRHTWEVPGGRREPGEEITCTAERELREETGAIEFDLIPVAVYCVTKNGVDSFGQLYLANVLHLGTLPESEIGEVKLFSNTPSELTYPLIQPVLCDKVSAMQNIFLQKAACSRN